MLCLGLTAPDFYFFYLLLYPELIILENCQQWLRYLS